MRVKLLFAILPDQIDTSRAVLFVTENQEFKKRNEEERLTGSE